MAVVRLTLRSQPKSWNWVSLVCFIQSTEFDWIRITLLQTQTLVWDQCITWRRHWLWTTMWIPSDPHLWMAMMRSICGWPLKTDILQARNRSTLHLPLCRCITTLSTVWSGSGPGKFSGPQTRTSRFGPLKPGPGPSLRWSGSRRSGPGSVRVQTRSSLY